MILMAIVSMGLIFGMPKLMENSKSLGSPLGTAKVTDTCVVDP